GRLSAAEVSQFVLDQAGLRSVPDAKSMVTALRSLLRFLFVTGRIDRELAAAVPTVANRKLATLPGRLRAGEAGLLLGGCDRDTEAGRRDFAILTLLARLGLRACEAAGMHLGDIDWRWGGPHRRGQAGGGGRGSTGGGGGGVGAGAGRRGGGGGGGGNFLPAAPPAGPPPYGGVPALCRPGGGLSRRWHPRCRRARMPACRDSPGRGAPP